MNILRNSIMTLNTLITRNYKPAYSLISRGYSLLSLQQPLLRMQVPLVDQIRGFKVKLKLKKRCKDCYIVVRDNRSYVICPTHPRHKQMSMVKKPRYTWILTHATQSKVRPY